MIPDILIVLAAIVVVIVIVGTGAWAIQREPAGHGQHGARREHRPWHLWPLALKVRRDHPRNMIARLRAGEGWRDAWACRWAPPMARTLRPLPPQREVYPRDAVDDLIDAMNIPGPVTHTGPPPIDPGGRPEQTRAAGRAGEPTWDAHGYWQPNGKTIADVLPPHVVAALERAQTDQTVIDSDLTAETRTALVEQFAGGDVYDGEGAAWFDVFDRIEARAHEAIAAAMAEVQRALAGATA